MVRPSNYAGRIMKMHQEPIGGAIKRMYVAFRVRGALMKAHRLVFLLILGLGLVGCLHPKFRPQSADDAENKEAQEKTIGDVSTVANVEPTSVLGVGLVVNLNGSGGGMPPASTYRTMLENDLKARGV